jgi:hypothetical protein
METRKSGSPEAIHPDEEMVVSRVLEALRSIDYGSVLIKIHQGKVVGIETATKLRLNGS